MRHVKVVAMVAAVFIVVAVAYAQTPRPAPPAEKDAVAALTQEMRLLRGDLGQIGRSSLRVQLLTARLQAQEQRIIHLDRRRTEASTRRADAQRARNETMSQVRMFGNPDRSQLSEQQLRDFELMLEEAKQRLADQERILQQAQTEENESTTALREEQDRWGEFNKRLEELDRTLGTR